MLKKIKRLIKKILGLPLGAQRYQYLFRTIKGNKCVRLMEIGTWDGQRALEMIKEAQKYSSAVEYYGFDLFEMMNEETFTKEISKRPPSMAVVEAKLAATGAKIKLFRGYTQETLPANISALPAMDLIFIDGGHAYETITNDWEYSQRLMDENTVVIFDDYWTEGFNGNMKDGCRQIVDAIDRNKYQVELLPIEDHFRYDWGILKIRFAGVQRLRDK